jgi:beta-glucanase (GH16 family)
MNLFSKPLLTAFLSLLLLFPNLNGWAQDYSLAWSDEFNGTKLDLNKWNYEIGNGEGGWGTGQKDYCTDRPENVKVVDGKLVITIRNEEISSFSYTSGRLNTKGKFFTKYGRIEARIKVPAGKGIGAAFWMLPQFEKFGWWPRSGEIDVAETNGDNVNHNYGTVHFMQWDIHQYSGNHVKIEGNLTKEFHDYVLEWDENSLKWYLDGKLYNEFNNKEPIDDRSPFQEEFFLIISAGVGSNFSGNVIEDKALPQTLEVDYIRVYKKFEAPALKQAFFTSAGNEIELKFDNPMFNPSSNPEFKLHDINKGELTIKSIGSKYRDNSSFIIYTNEKIDKNSVLALDYQGNTMRSMNNQDLKSFKSIPINNLCAEAAPSIASAEIKESFNLQVKLTRPSKINDTIHPIIKVFSNGEQKAISKITFTGPQIISINLTDPIFAKDSVSIILNDHAIVSIDGALNIENKRTATNNIPKKINLPGIIESEDYTVARGIKTESCKDEGGGKNLGFIETGDWMDYDINVLETGKYKFEYRVAAVKAGSEIELELNSKTLEKIKVPSTENWQKWISIETPSPIQLHKGIYKLRVYAKSGGFNINRITVK